MGQASVVPVSSLSSSPSSSAISPSGGSSMTASPQRLAWADFQSACFLLSQTTDMLSTLGGRPTPGGANLVLREEIWTQYDHLTGKQRGLLSPPPIPPPVDPKAYCRTLTAMWPACLEACLAKELPSIPNPLYDGVALGTIHMTDETCRNRISLWYPRALDAARTALYVGLSFAMVHSFEMWAYHHGVVTDAPKLWNRFYAMMYVVFRGYPLLSDRFASLCVSDVPTDTLMKATCLPSALVSNIVLAYDVAHSPQTVLHRVQRDFCS